MFRLRFLTAGESHGPALTVIVEGMPAGLPLSEDDINRDLARRQRGFSSGGRMRIERDRAQLSAGVMNGRTIGAPIALRIENRDWANWAERDVPPMTVPRPGHADLTGAIKYGHRDLRLSLERASARETAARVAVGAIARRLLGEFGIAVGGYVIQIGSVQADVPDLPYAELFDRAEDSEVRCPDAEVTHRMVAAIQEAIRRRDTLGGLFELVATGVPPGLGSYVHWDRRLDARLAWAVMSIPAVKGVEIGPAFANAAQYGTQVHDEIFVEDGDALTSLRAVEPERSPDNEGARRLVTARGPLLEAASAKGEGARPGRTDRADASGELVRRTNRAGGFEGGITTGQPVVARAAMKPISTTLQPLRSVDLATGEPATTQYERSDFCAVPRAVVVGEAVVAWVLADALLEKLGGDSLEEMRPRFRALRRGHVEDLPMDNRPWRFGYNDQ